MLVDYQRPFEEIKKTIEKEYPIRMIWVNKTVSFRFTNYPPEFEAHRKRQWLQLKFTLHAFHSHSSIVVHDKDLAVRESDIAEYMVATDVSVAQCVINCIRFLLTGEPNSLSKNHVWLLSKYIFDRMQCIKNPDNFLKLCYRLSKTTDDIFYEHFDAMTDLADKKGFEEAKNVLLNTKIARQLR